MTKGEDSQPPSSARVLLVEDDELVRLSTEDALAMAGFRVTALGSADEALLLLASQDFDLLVSDIVMPGRMDGIDLARVALVLRPGLRIILTSGHTDRQRALAELRSDVRFLPKPYALDALTHLALSAAPAPGVTRPAPHPPPAFKAE